MRMRDLRRAMADSALGPEDLVGVVDPRRGRCVLAVDWAVASTHDGPVFVLYLKPKPKRPGSAAPPRPRRKETR